MQKKAFIFPTFIFLVLVLIVLASFSYPLDEVQEEEKHSYTLIWEENFNGNDLDTTHWNKIDRLFPDWCKYMTHNDQLYDLRKGRMRLYAKQNKGIEPNDTAPYLTGGISTWHKVKFTYGKIEVRARIKGAKGCWPAIWIKNENSNNWGYPKRAEIDILEYYNKEKEVRFSLHSNYTDVLKKDKEPQSTIKVPINKNQYNTYTLEILPNKIIYSVNGKRFMTYPKLNTNLAGQFPYGDECYLLIDMQVGNKWLKEIGNEDLPAYMDIDWVRIYDLSEATH